jgi:DnaJ homolog subfamily B member 12
MLAQEAKENARLCLSRARAQLQAENFEVALRFARKSDRFYPSDEAKKLIRDIELRHAASQAPTRPQERKPRDQIPPKNTPQRAKAYTPEQAAVVKRIRVSKDYYQVLGRQYIYIPYSSFS